MASCGEIFRFWSCTCMGGTNTTYPGTQKKNSLWFLKSYSNLTWLKSKILIWRCSPGIWKSTISRLRKPLTGKEMFLLFCWLWNVLHSNPLCMLSLASKSCVSSLSHQTGPQELTIILMGDLTTWVFNIVWIVLCIMLLPNSLSKFDDGFV